MDWARPTNLVIDHILFLHVHREHLVHKIKVEPFYMK
jgi:hypothetical protein